MEVTPSGKFSPNSACASWGSNSKDMIINFGKVNVFSRYELQE
jgi:hypothetical protein